MPLPSAVRPSQVGCTCPFLEKLKSSPLGYIAVIALVHAAITWHEKSWRKGSDS